MVISALRLHLKHLQEFNMIVRKKMVDFMTIYLVHDYADQTKDKSPAPGFYYEEVAFLSKAIRSLGYSVVCINGVEELCERILTIGNHDIVFNLVSGSESRNREALVPALCESHRLKYIGTDAFGAAFSMHKFQSKLFARHLGVNVPRGIYFDPMVHTEEDFRWELNLLNPPFVVKPNHENMSRGVMVFQNDAGLFEHIKESCALFGQAHVVEEYIKGTEASAVIAGTGHDAQVLSVLAYQPQGFGEIDIFDGKRKTENDILYVKPDSSKELQDYIRNCSLLLHRGLHMKDFSRVDWRITEDEAYFLEITAFPCLLEGTEFHHAAKYAGAAFLDFLGSVIRSYL